MPETEKAHVKPQLFVTASQGVVLVGLTNLSGAASIYLHKERHSLRGAWTIAASGTLAPVEWKGGELWISASADDTPYQRLLGELGRAASQRKQAGSEPGQAPGPVPALGPVLPPLPSIPPIPGLPGFPWYPGI